MQRIDATKSFIESKTLSIKKLREQGDSQLKTAVFDKIQYAASNGLKNLSLTKADIDGLGVFALRQNDFSVEVLGSKTEPIFIVSWY